MQLLVELRRLRLLALPPAPSEGPVPDNGQQPGTALAGVGPAESAEVLECPQVGILDHIAGIVLVAHEVSRQGIGRIQVRQYDRFESSELVGIHYSSASLALSGLMTSQLA